MTDAVEEFVTELSKKDIDQVLANINTHMFMFVGTSALESMTRAFEEKIRTADAENRDVVLWTSYSALENYFTEVMGGQLKGVMMMTNELNWKIERAAQNALQMQSYQGTAESYLEEKIIPRFKKQVDLFMSSLERLVVAAADTRTVIRGGRSMFPITADDVFYSADLIAQQFHPDHRAAFVLRIAGDPADFDGYISEAKKLFGTPQYIPIKEQNERYYDAPVPSGYLDHYLGWYLDKNDRWHFKNQTKIKIAKIRFPRMEGDLDPTTRDDFPFPRTYSFPYNQKDVVTFKKINLMTGEASANGYPYANSFVTARATPRFMHAGSIKTHYLEGKLSPGSLIDYSLKDMEFVSEFDTYSGKGKVSVQAQMFFEIISDNQNTTKISLRGNVSEKFKTGRTGQNSRLDFEQRTDWQVWVNSEKLMKNSRTKNFDEHSIWYDNKKMWPYRDNNAEIIPYESDSFTVENGYDRKRQIFFKVSRHGIDWDSYNWTFIVVGAIPITVDDYENHINAELRTKLEYFELRPL